MPLTKILEDIQEISSFWEIFPSFAQFLMEIWASFRAKFQDEMKILSKASAKSDIYSIYCNLGRSIQRVGAY